MFYFTDDRITEYEMIDTQTSLTAYIVIYGMIIQSVLDINTEGVSSVTAMALVHTVRPIENGARSNNRNPCAFSYNIGLNMLPSDSFIW